MNTKATKIVKAILLLTIIGNLSFIERRPEDHTLNVKTKQIFTEGSQKYLTANVRLTNNTSDTLKYLSWSCSFQLFYLLKSETLTEAPYKCSKNIPIVLILPPHKSDSVELKFKINERHTTRIKYKIGMKLAKEGSDNLLNQLLHKPIKYKIIWSDEVTVLCR